MGRYNELSIIYHFILPFLFIYVIVNFKINTNERIKWLRSYKSNNHQLTKCHKILENITYGPEDISFSKFQSLLFISSHDRYLFI
jgi:hypothetical protein